MPHFQIDYSANLEDTVDMAALCEAIRAEAAGIDAFPMPGIRVRATRVDHYAIADGNPKHGFVDISVRLREGRPDDVKQDAIARIFEAAKACLVDAMATHSIALSAEMRDIDAALSPKTGTIRDHLPKSE
ncbi:5-carboxymethyl-2-hydroxymuconate isomerase [Jannaschia sp. EhC01]|uniref:5-carboxymethyl-2-hydroxymuconate Delta-isomerase n=1 Tax=Gymnodinialimonas phycosphaerae TaxID=2841589 RepID=A0A975YE80_9RHOB|nr:5-carboxymethyl-2-hydroxymuconate Delta-isomerase [Gymnodinialimonas phycosphaerae]MBY4893301.1 5-carboxymethyl-2-hydroxymuconate Delta-isomerase [Gymnodinialimonas phycosphaerae]OAN70711.1 5-carboxymethyl-2-hydroxymuconate isomerase [Jannaschia sp. EhC01]